MDGFTGREGILVLAATNQPDVLDKALLRLGRFDRRVVVNLPDRNGREAILRVHTRKVPLAPSANLAELAAGDTGFDRRGPEERRQRGRPAGGAPRAERGDGMLGGRVAEELVYGTRTTGAESDIEQATELARQMVTRWGMSDRLGMVQLAPRQNPYLGYSLPGEKPFSEETARLIDAEVRGIIKESHDTATRLLTQHRRQLDALVAALLARDTLDEKEILEVTGLPAAPALRDQPRVEAVASSATLAR